MLPHCAGSKWYVAVRLREALGRDPVAKAEGSAPSHEAAKKCVGEVVLAVLLASALPLPRNDVTFAIVDLPGDPLEHRVRRVVTLGTPLEHRSYALETALEHCGSWIFDLKVRFFLDSSYV